MNWIIAHYIYNDPLLKLIKSFLPIIFLINQIKKQLLIVRLTKEQVYFGLDNWQNYASFSILTQNNECSSQKTKMS